jgi:hypothetical protein
VERVFPLSSMSEGSVTLIELHVAPVTVQELAPLAMVHVFGLMVREPEGTVPVSNEHWLPYEVPPLLVA